MTIEEQERIDAVNRYIMGDKSADISYKVPLKKTSDIIKHGRMICYKSGRKSKKGQTNLLFEGNGTLPDSNKIFIRDFPVRKLCLSIFF